MAIFSSQTGCKLYTGILSICCLSELHALAPLTQPRHVPSLCSLCTIQPTASTGLERLTGCTIACPALPQLTERPYEEGSLEVPFPQTCSFPAGSLPGVTAVTCLLVEADWCKCEGSCWTHSSPALSQKNRALCVCPGQPEQREHRAPPGGLWSRDAVMWA